MLPFAQTEAAPNVLSSWGHSMLAFGVSRQDHDIDGQQGDCRTYRRLQGALCYLRTVNRSVLPHVDDVSGQDVEPEPCSETLGLCEREGRMSGTMVVYKLKKRSGQCLHEYIHALPLTGN